MAQGWADKCTFGHGDQEGTVNISPFQPKVGQNLAISTSSTWSGIAGATESVDNWHDEVNNYDYNSNTCQKGKCGHYTQVIYRTLYLSPLTICALLAILNSPKFLDCFRNSEFPQYKEILLRRPGLFNYHHGMGSYTCT